MDFQVTPDPAALSFLVKRIESWRQPDQSNFHRHFLARAGAFALVIASTFEAFVHTGAAMVKVPIAAFVIFINAIPTIKLDPVRKKLSGWADASSVKLHAARVAKYVSEILIIPASLLNPDMAVPLHERVGLVKVPELAVKKSSEKTRLWSLINARETKVAAVVILSLAILGAMAWSGEMNKRIEQQRAILSSAVEGGVSVVGSKTNFWTLLAATGIGMGLAGYGVGRLHVQRKGDLVAQFTLMETSRAHTPLNINSFDLTPRPVPAANVPGVETPGTGHPPLNPVGKKDDAQQILKPQPKQSDLNEDDFEKLS